METGGMTQKPDAHVGDIWRWNDRDSWAIVLVIQDRNKEYEFEGLTLHAVGGLVNRVNLVHTWFPAYSEATQNYGWEQLA
jgi:hypothetical protein